LASRATAALSCAELSRRAGIFHAKARGRRYDELLDLRFDEVDDFFKACVWRAALPDAARWSLWLENVAVGDVMDFAGAWLFDAGGTRRGGPNGPYIVTGIQTDHLELCSATDSLLVRTVFQPVGRVLPPPRTDYVMVNTRTQMRR
jgi:hypothetical protein